MRCLRWLLAVGVLSWCLVVPPPTALADAGAKDLAACAQSASTLSALFVFDQSGSLAGSDGQGIRYDALEIAVGQLAKFTRSGGGALAVEAAVAAFDNGYRPARSVARWTRLDLASFNGDVTEQAKTLKEFMSRAERGTAHNPNGGTDFETALEGGLSDLDDRGGPGRCRVLFWFTDGEFASARDTVDQARTRMCMPGGLLDQIRRQGIVIVGLQLGAASDDLRSMSEGKGQGQDCGTVPIPSDWAGGIYLRADDPAGLKRIFGSVLDMVQGCTTTGALKNRIDPGIRRFRLTIETPSRVTALRLDAPDGTGISASLSGSTTENGYLVTTTQDDHYVSTEVLIPAGRPDGEWVVTTDPATTLDDAEFCVFHDLRLVLADPRQELAAGVNTDLVLRAVDRSGVVANLSEYRKVVVGASAVGSDGKIRKAAGTTRGNDIIVNVTPLPTDARLELSATVQLTTKSKLALSPVTDRFKLAVLLAKEFPLVRPVDELDLGEAKRKNPTSAPIHIIGSPVGPTRVCFDAPVDVIVPKEAAGTVPKVPIGCLDVKTGEAMDVVVSVQPTEAAEGAGSATLPITLHSAAAGKKKSQQISYDLPVVWRFSDPLNATVLIAVIAVVGGVSLLLPLLALGLANLLSAKFETKGLRAGTIPVLITSDDVRRQAPLLTQPERVIDAFLDLAVVPTPNPRRIMIDDVELLARATLNPFGAPSFVATAPKGSRIMSSVGLPIAGDRQARVSPALGFVVLAVVADADLTTPGREIAGRLVVLLRDDRVDPAALDGLMKQRMSWDKIVTAWRSGGDPGVSDASLSEPQPRSDSADSSYLDFD